MLIAMMLANVLSYDFLPMDSTIYILYGYERSYFWTWGFVSEL